MIASSLSRLPSVEVVRKLRAPSRATRSPSATCHQVAGVRVARATLAIALGKAIPCRGIPSS